MQWDKAMLNFGSPFKCVKKICTENRNHTCFGVSSTEFPAGLAPPSTAPAAVSFPFPGGAAEAAFPRPAGACSVSQPLRSCKLSSPCALGPSPRAQPLNQTRTRAPGRHQALSRPPAPGSGAHRENRLGGVCRVLPARWRQLRTEERRCAALGATAPTGTC